MSTRCRPGITNVPFPDTLRVCPNPDTIISLSGGHFLQQDSNTTIIKITIRSGPSRGPNKSKSIFFPFFNILMGCDSIDGKAVPPYRVADDLVLYCYRHTYCTDLQDAGVPINIAKDLMGHADISITSKIYTHSTEKSFNSARQLINKLHSSDNVENTMSEIRQS